MSETNVIVRGEERTPLSDERLKQKPKANRRIVQNVRKEGSGPAMNRHETQGEAYLSTSHKYSKYIVVTNVVMRNLVRDCLVFSMVLVPICLVNKQLSSLNKLQQVISHLGDEYKTRFLLP